MIMKPEDELVVGRLNNDLDLTRLAPYLAARLNDAEGVPIARQFSGGNANLLYLLQYPDAAYVLRRPPFGTLAPGSHDMNREFRVLERLHEDYPLAPRAYLASDDIDLIGAPFLVMEYRPGIVVRRELPSVLANNAAACGRLGEAIVNSLAELHAVDPERVGLGDLGNPEGYLERQLSGWQRRWAAVADRPRNDIELVVRWLDDNRPISSRTSLLHNDFKLDNMILDPEDASRAIAVIDWDMCTRGDPLVELGFLLNYWGEAGDPDEWLEVASMPTWHTGFASRRDVISRYGALTGIDTAALDWYRVFGAFKLAVILQQIWAGYLRGERTNPRFATFGGRVDALIRKCDVLMATA